MSDPKIAVLVRFRSALPFAEVLRIAEERADQFRALTGLTQKYYLEDASTGEVAGLYLWDSQEAVEEYQKSALRASIAEAYQAEAPPRIEVYQVAMALR